MTSRHRASFYLFVYGILFLFAFCFYGGLEVCVANGGLEGEPGEWWGVLLREVFVYMQ